MIDSARCLENREYYRRLIDFSAHSGMNTLLWHFTDDQGCSLDFPSAPRVGDPHAYSAQEMREFIAYAQAQGITLIPELETLGHSRYLTRHPQYRHLLENDHDFTAICPVHPDTRILMRKLLRDVAKIFPSEYIHAGLDEVHFGGHPLTAEALCTRSEVEIFAEYTRFIHEEIRRLDRKMIMWVDQPSYDTGLLDLLPKDIVIAVWQYTPGVTDTLAQAVLDKGFGMLLCPGLVTYDQQAYPGDFALPNIARMSAYQSLRGAGKILGALTTVWTPMRYLHDCLWPSLRVAADAMTGNGLTLPQSLARHMRDFHGIIPSTALRQALGRCSKIAPRRPEYLGILKGSPEGLDAAHLTQRASDWGEIHTILQGSADLVRREHRAYDTLCSFTGWMAYLYRRSAHLAAGTPDADTGEALADEGRQWLVWLERVWDQERFPDDPRKHRPVFPWETNEYLLINFRQSLHKRAASPEAPALSLR
jgi:hypothetical protein